MYGRLRPRSALETPVDPCWKITMLHVQFALNPDGVLRDRLHDDYCPGKTILRDHFYVALFIGHYLINSIAVRR